MSALCLYKPFDIGFLYGFSYGDSGDFVEKHKIDLKNLIDEMDIEVIMAMTAYRKPGYSSYSQRDAELALEASGFKRAKVRLNWEHNGDARITLWVLKRKPNPDVVNNFEKGVVPALKGGFNLLMQNAPVTFCYFPTGCGGTTFTSTNWAQEPTPFDRRLGIGIIPRSIKFPVGRIPEMRKTHNFTVIARTSKHRIFASGWKPTEWTPALECEFMGKPLTSPFLAFDFKSE